MTDKQIRPQIVQQTSDAVRIMLDRGGDNWMVARETLYNPELGLSIDEMQAIEHKVGSYQWFWDCIRKDACLDKNYNPDYKNMQ